MPRPMFVTPATNWQRMGEMWFRDRPAETIDEFIARSGGTMIISAYHDGYTLHDGKVAHQLTYESLEAAQAAGDAIAASLLTRQQDALVVDAGLSSTDWTFACSDAFVWFENRAHHEIRIERYGSSQWVVQIRGERTGIASTAPEAAALALRQD